MTTRPTKTSPPMLRPRTAIRPVRIGLSPTNSVNRSKVLIGNRPFTYGIMVGALSLLAAAAPAAAQSSGSSFPGLIVSTPTPPPPPAAPQGQPQQLPGLVINTPQNTPPPGAPPGLPAPQATPARPPAPAQQAAPKAPPRPKTASTGESKKGPIGGPGAASGGSAQTIILLINDEPITAHDVEERSRLMSISSNIPERASENMKRLIQSPETNARWKEIVEGLIKENQTKPGMTREIFAQIVQKRQQAFGDQLRQQAMSSARASVLPGLRKNALEELIEERLKMQEAKRLNIVVDEKDVNDVVKNLAQRNNKTEKEFTEQLGAMGIEVNSFKSRFRANMSWAEVVRRRFGHQVNVNQREVEKFMSQGPKGQDEVELQISRIVLSMPVEQRAMAQRLEEAEAIRRDFKACSGMSALAARVKGARFEDLGVRKPAQVAEPFRTFLLNAKEGEMVPANPGVAGIELYALCQRRVTTADEQKRNEASSELRQKEFELLAKRHLKDLRQDAHIEWRDKSQSSASAAPTANAAN
jgi:peptidyl-prolyl cis-trans isomerase SurA